MLANGTFYLPVRPSSPHATSTSFPAPRERTGWLSTSSRSILVSFCCFSLLLWFLGHCALNG